VGIANFNGAVELSAGTLNADNLNVGDGTINSKDAFTHSGGTANIGNLTIDGSGTNSYNCTGSPTINITGNWTNKKTFTAASSTVNMKGASVQNISGTLSGNPGKFYNLTFD